MMLYGALNWTGHLPSDDDVARAPRPVFSEDYGTQWQYMATKPVVESLCAALRLNEMITDVLEPRPEDLGLYTCFKIKGWEWFLWIRWSPDGDRDNRFEFDVRLRSNWWHRVVHWRDYNSRWQSVQTAIENAINGADQLEGVVFENN